MAIKSLFQKNIRNFADSSNLLRTELWSYHKDTLGAKMVPFAGYDMPVQYKTGGMAEHLYCRSKSSIFDVSHMGQLKIYGKDRDDFIMRLSVGNITKCDEGFGYLSLMLNKNAGIIDDTIITKFPDHINMVLNAGNKFIDMDHMNEVLKDEFSGKDIKMEYLEDASLIALQGPMASKVLSSLVSEDLDKLTFMKHVYTKIPKIDADIQLCRCGYTGEDGFEISIASNKVQALCEILLENPDCLPAGLAARDSLRLEAGLCLHGNDMTQEISPAEATLMWLVRKPKDFPIRHIGREALTKIRKDGFSRKRVGFKLDGKGVVREGSEIQNLDGEKIGFVSSGTFLPSIKVSAGMAFIPPELANKGEKLFAVAKGRKFPITVSSPPFVECHYFK